MTTHYPPGTDGMAVMRNTATALQATLRDLLMADCTASAIDEDMLELRISGMHARALLRVMADRGIIEYPRIPSGFVTSDAVLSEQEIEDFRQRFLAAQASGEPPKIAPPNAVEIRRRTPEERHRYLTEHRDEAIKRGIPADLIDMLIADAQTSDHSEKDTP